MSRFLTLFPSYFPAFILSSTLTLPYLPSLLLSSCAKSLWASLRRRRNKVASSRESSNPRATRQRSSDSLSVLLAPLMETPSPSPALKWPWLLHPRRHLKSPVVAGGRGLWGKGVRLYWQELLPHYIPPWGEAYGSWAESYKYARILKDTIGEYRNLLSVLVFQKLP